MYLPPTMLPHRLRVLVDPPMEFPQAQDDDARRVRSAVRPVRPARVAAEPSLLRRSRACTD